ncbi:MAG: LamG-like jellyroll fold domain-containing protein, partial [Limisphaerales bacterium]
TQTNDCVDKGASSQGCFDGGSYSDATGTHGNLDPYQFGGWYDQFLGPAIPEASSWHYEVETYDGTNWTLYIDGQARAWQADPVGAINSTTPWAIGTGTAGGALGSSGYGDNFAGNICQVALYTNALTPAQINAHYFAGLYGATNLPPVITAQPAPLAVPQNAAATLSVAAASAAPVSYHWWKGLSQLSGQTNSTLLLENVQSGNVGGYIVVITNVYGAVTSSVATLSLNVPSNSIGVNFTFSAAYVGTGNNLVLGPANAAGVVPMINWKNLVANSPAAANTTWSGLQDSSGAAIPVTLTVSGVSNASFQTNDTDTNCANAGLMYDFWQANSFGTLTTDSGITCTFSNLTPGAVYDVYAYLPADQDGSDNWGHITANGGLNRYYFYWSDTPSICGNGYWTIVRNSDGARHFQYPFDVNYIAMQGTRVAADGTLTVTLTLEGDTNNPTAAASLAGIQLVAPSPVAVATQPANDTVYTNGAGVFMVSATNGEPRTIYPAYVYAGEYSGRGLYGLILSPYTYQWYVISGGVTNAIAGATNATYATPPATMGMNGNSYFAVATDAVGRGASSSVATLTVVPGQSDGVVSVQLLPNTPYTDPASVQRLAPADLTGALPTTDWNPRAVNIIGDLFTWNQQVLPGLNDESGVGSAVQLTVRGATDGWNVNDPPPDSAPITKLLNTFVLCNPPPLPNNLLGNGFMQYIFTNLDDSKTYDVYVYYVGNQATYPDIDAGNGVTNYAGPEFNSVNQSSNFVPSQNQNPNGTRDQGNYVRLTGITPTAGAITVTVRYDIAESIANMSGDNLGVSGLQLVNSSLDHAPATITGQPINQRVLTNTTATFTVQASGIPVPTYQWYEVVGGVTNQIAGATNSTYTTAPVQDSDSGDGFFVVASNSTGIVASEVALLTAGHMVTASGFLEADEYFGNYGDNVAALSTLYPTAPSLPAPDNVEYLSTFNDNADLPDNGGERIFGWFTPPVTGNYIFFEASDDSSTLWLSTNSDPAHVYQTAQNQADIDSGNEGTTDWNVTDTNSGEYAYFSTGEWRSDQFELGGGQNAFANLIGVWSAWPGLNAGGSIPLKAGTPYYIELDHYQGNGGQGAAVTYKLAGNPDPNTGDTSLLTGNVISASVPDTVAPEPQPLITHISISGSKVTVSGDNGLVNAAYNVLTSTNLAAPLASWTTIATPRFDSTGNFSFTNNVTAGSRQQFYLLQVPAN